MSVFEVDLSAPDIPPTRFPALSRLLDGHDVPVLDPDSAAAVLDVAHGVSDNTLRAYAADCARYDEFCVAASLEPNNANSVARWVRHLGDRPKISISSIERSLAGLAKRHEILAALYGEDLADPTKHDRVRIAMKKLRRELHTRPTQTPPLTAERLVTALNAIDGDTMADARDLTMLLVGFYGAMRRSELAAMRRDDLAIDDNGAAITLHQTKTAQDRPVVVGIAAHRGSRYDPVAHLEAWLQRLDETDAQAGVVWPRTTRSGGLYHDGPPLAAPAVNDIVTRRCAAVGLDGYSAHSLRRGFVTEARNRRLDVTDIMAHTRHTTIEMMDRYDDHPAGLWTRNASAAITL